MPSSRGLSPHALSAMVAIPGVAAMVLEDVMPMSVAVPGIAASIGLTALAHAGLSRRRRPDVQRALDLAAHDALIDDLTGLANRRALYARLEEALADRETHVALLLCDLDGFNDVNDTLGHIAGDLVLAEAARRLDRLAIETDLIARLGADEFALLLVGAPAGDARGVARRVRDLFQQPMAVEGLRVRLGATVGVASAPHHATDATLLVQRADVALGLAKSHRSGVEVYAPERDPHSRARLALTAELQAALEAGELEVHFQPQADLATGAITGAEALVRWRHPEHGLMTPASFLPLAERARLMGPLALLVLEQAIGECARWRDEGHDLSVAVNLSVTNLHDADLPLEVAALLAQSGLDPRHLEVEITEDTVIAEGTAPFGVLEELRELGLRVSLDDFGTGYASMAYLKRLTVDALKIDRSFVRDLATTHADGAIVRAVVALAHALDLRVVAEGVASAEAWAAARDAGCDLGQGFWLGRPMPAEDFRAWLNAREWLRAA